MSLGCGGAAPRASRGLALSQPPPLERFTVARAQNEAGLAAGLAAALPMASLVAGTLTMGTFFSIVGRRYKRRRRKRSERKGDAFAFILKCQMPGFQCNAGTCSGLQLGELMLLPVTLYFTFSSASCWHFVEF